MPQADANPIRQVGEFDRAVNVAVVIPTYNEAENIASITQQLLDLPDKHHPGILFVDDASPDGTGDIADRLAHELPGRIIVAHRTGKLGLGTAYVAGFKLALETNVANIVQMDCDMSHPIAEVPDMLSRLAHADVVVGTRYSDGGAVDPNWSRHRVLLSKWANFGIRFILGLKIHDATGGFKAYRRPALKAINLDALKITGFGFQAEVAYQTQRRGLSIAEHPYTFLERTAGKSKMSLKIAFEALWRLTLLRIRGR